MKKFWQDYQVYIIIALLIIVTVLVIYFLGKKAGKKYVPDTVTLPSDTQPGGSTSFNPGPYTDAIYDEVYGWGFRDAQPYWDALELSNTQLVAIYNDWNQRYFPEDNETIIQAIRGESTAWNSDWLNATGALLGRYDSLGLT